MAPTSINDLPVEIHTSILKHLLSISREPIEFPSISSSSGRHTPAKPLLLFPIKFEWTEEDTHSPSLFPFNVAYASKLWRDILARIPECWTRVVFDVAKDPIPFLDAFLWSKSLENIEVFVFNSDNTQMVDKTRERSFVSAIAESLQPHVHRCKSIIFDVTYVTSLPPPMMFFIREAPYLENISLDCRIDNLGLLHDQIELGPQQDFVTSFPRLYEISLTGFWFMYLVLHASKSDWLSHLPGRSSMRISHFIFPRHGQYSLLEFASFLSKADFYAVHYCDLSLAYTYDGSEPKPDFIYEIRSDQHYHAVSKDFIDHLYAISDFLSMRSLSFEACEIPKLKITQPEDQLILTNIIDNDEGTSLNHIFEVWAGGDLIVRSCPSFNDTLLSKIMHPSSDTPDPDIPFPAKYLNSLTIVDCDNLSSGAVREFMYFCSEASLTISGRPMELSVRGRCPILSDEDKEWFKQNANRMSVYWEVINHQGKGKAFQVRTQRRRRR